MKINVFLNQVILKKIINLLNGIDWIRMKDDKKYMVM